MARVGATFHPERTYFVRVHQGVTMPTTIPERPQKYARIGGAIYLFIILGGTLGELFLRGTLIVPGDPAATAGKIMSSIELWRTGILLEFLMLASSVGLTLILYVLLRPVQREIALLSVFFNLVCIAIEATNEMNLMKALIPLGSGDYLRAFTPDQLNTLAHLPLRLYPSGFGAGLIFFGFECLVLGYLIYRSGFLPKTIGVLMTVAGICYLVNSSALILSPPLAGALFPAIMIPVFIGEMSLCLWLLLKGVDREGWKARTVSG